MALSDVWEISHVVSRVVGAGLLARLAVEIKPFEYGRALALEEEAAEQTAALRALRKVMRPPDSGRPSRRARAPGRGRARSRRAHARPKGSAGAELVGKKGDRGSESLDESEQSEDSEVDNYWAEIMYFFDQRKRPADVKSSQDSGGILHCRCVRGLWLR